MKKLNLTLLISLLVLQGVLAQRQVSGRVSASGEVLGLPGVAVRHAATGTSTLTDYEGNFSLSVPEEGGTLVFSKAGYVTVEVEIGTRSSIDVTLSRSTSASSGDETINTGFGSLSKDELTSSIAQIGGSDIGSQPVIDVEQANQGRASGVFIQNNGGKLGEGTTVRIRGGSSLTGSNEPLYVVDGVPLSSNNQSEINPNNIASMEVLKDASAAALYGSRAANGVILITTKSGQSGKLKVDLDYQFGVSDNPRRYNLYSPLDYNMQFIEYTLRQPILGVANQITEEKLKQWAQGAMALAKQYPDSNYVINLNAGNSITINPLKELIYDTDWQDEIFRTATSHRASLSVSGGSKKHRLLGAVSYLDQEGILVGNDYTRINTRVSLNSDFSDRLSSNVSLTYFRTENNRLNEDQDLGSPIQAIVLPPSDAYDKNDNYRLHVRTLEYNPLTEINYSDNFDVGNSLVGNAGINYKVTDNLVLHADGGLDFFDQRYERRQGPQTLEGQPDGFSRLTESYVINYIVNLNANYTRVVGGNPLSTLVGASYQNSYSEETFLSARVNSISELERKESPSLQDLPIPGGAFAFLSYYTRFNYSIQNKYFVQLSGRVDGSSRFGEDNRFGFFPAVSAGWKLSDEAFLSDVSALSHLKLKTSIGLVGNTPDGDFLYRRNYLIVNYGDTTGLRLSNLANSGLKWETTTQFDVGIEFGFLDNRISGELGYYQKNTSDLLFPVPISQTSGLAFALENVGELENKGIELNISSVNIEGPDFTWTTDLNITTNQNEIKDIGGETLIAGVNAFIEGEQASAFYIQKYKGVDQITGKALYDDGNGGTTTDWENAPRMVVGDPNPDYFGGISNTLTYKNFDLNFMFQFVGGVDIYNATGEFLANSGIQNLGQRKDQTNRWYAVGDKAKFPALDPTLENTNPSTRFLEDGSYMRLKNLSLTYNLPADMISSWGLSYFQVYIGGQNLLTFTKYTGYDPDVNYVDPTGGTIGANINRGIDNFTAPQARIFTTGIKIGL